MPLYEYCCRKCGEEFEELVFNANEKVLCPACHSKQTRRLLSTFAHRSGSGGKIHSTASAGCAGCSSSSCHSCASGGK